MYLPQNRGYRAGSNESVSGVKNRKVYQGQHIGDELMKRIMKCFANLLYVKIMPSDPKTIPFYERYGFQQYDNYAAMVWKNF